MSFREVPPHVFEHMMAATGPIYIQHREDRPEPVGSAVVLRISDRIFVVTAAHVLDAFTAADRPHIGLDRNLVPLSGPVVKSRRPPLGRTADRFDLALVEIDTAALGLPSVPGVPPSWVEVSDRSYDDSLVRLAGYPISLQRPAVADGGMETHMLHLDVVGMEREDGVSSDLHVHASYDPDGVYVDERPAPATPLRGCSGGGLWAFDDDGAVRLVGIMTDFDESEKRIWGTRMWAALLPLKQHAPELVYQFRPPDAR